MIGIVALIAAAYFVTSSHRTAQALPLDCELPDYWSEPLEAPGAPAHFHPTVAIVVYARDAANTAHFARVTRLFTPPAGLGIYTLSSRQRENWIYRQIHEHEDGVLHVEPQDGGTLRLCHLFKLWRSASGAGRTFDEFDPRKAVTVIVGQEREETMSLQQLLLLPLNNDERIVILVEEGLVM